MNRLQLEVHRLYVPAPPSGTEAGKDAGSEAPPEACSLIDAEGRVRAMVLELARPADWDQLSRVWKGVQIDLDLPAPAIAVTGTDGYQLWFSLSEPVPAAQARAFLESLQVRYLSDIKASRVTVLPALEAGSVRHARRVPAAQTPSGLWSAFVAPDLAPVFAEEPWLDLPPNPEGQALLLAPLGSIAPADLERAAAQLRPAVRTGPALAPAPPSTVPAPDGGPAPVAGPWDDPKRFLLAVMNDDRVDLGLRIEAAKALLPGFEDARSPR